MKIQYENVRDAAIAVLTGKFIASNAYIRKEKRSQMNNQSSYLNKQKKRKKKKMNLKQVNNKNKAERHKIKNINNKKLNKIKNCCFGEKNQQN